jgi:hypothetical protein
LVQLRLFGRQLSCLGMAGGNPALRSIVVAVLTLVAGTAFAVAVNSATSVSGNVVLWVAVVLSVLVAVRP